MVKLTCKARGAKTLASGEYDPETNALEVGGIRGKWEDGSPDCEHQEYDAEEVDEDYDLENVI